MPETLERPVRLDRFEFAAWENDIERRCGDDFPNWARSRRLLAMRHWIHWVRRTVAERDGIPMALVQVQGDDWSFHTMRMAHRVEILVLDMSRHSAWLDSYERVARERKAQRWESEHRRSISWNPGYDPETGRG